MSNNDSELQHHIIELESRLAFQDDTLLALHNELLEHQRRIEKMQRQINMLAQKLQQQEESGILRTDEEPPPPHY